MLMMPLRAFRRHGGCYATMLRLRYFRRYAFAFFMPYRRYA